MVGTKAKWFRPPGSKPVYEPQRPGRKYKPPPGYRDTYRDLPTPLHERKPPPTRLPGHGDPRFPGYNPDHYKRSGSPQAPSVPAARPARPAPRIGRYLPLLRRVFRHPALTVVDVLSELLVKNPDPLVPPAPPLNYRWCAGPWNMPDRVPRPPGLGHWLAPAFLGRTGACSLGGPIDGQAVQPFLTYGESFAAPAPERLYWRRRYQHSSAQRDYVSGTMTKVFEAVGYQPLPHAPILRMGFPDPNYDRYTQPSPWEVPTKPLPDVGFAEPLPGPTANPDLPYEPDYQWQWDYGVAPVVAVPPTTGNPAPPGVGWGRLPPVQRQPPSPGEKQRKVLTKTAKIGLAVYAALDKASEGAEIVDALYDALPDDVKRRWDRPDRVGDNFGQYGPGGADWKLQALYYNWHRVDVEQALKNIIKNHLEDKIIGGIQARLPRNAGNAHALSEKALSKKLDEWFCENLGLCDEEN